MTSQSRGFLFAGASAGHKPAVSPTAAISGENSGLVHAPFLLMTLALIGLAVAFYDSYAIYNGQLLWCPPPINGCNEVAASPYARILGLPVGYYGMVYYSSHWGFCFSRRRR
jgi:hypothetical protein